MTLHFSLEYSGRGRSSIAVYPELLFLYYPRVGGDGIILWLFLAMQAKDGYQTDTDAVAKLVNFSQAQFDEALAGLLQVGLVAIDTGEGGQKIVVCDPLTASEFQNAFSQHEMAAACEPELTEETTQSSTDPFGDLLQYYEEQVGWITAKICDDLARWVDDGLEPAVIKQAITEMMQKADSPRFAYLNAILLAWHKNGWYSLQDLEQAKAKKESLEGVPNAAAYREPDTADIERIRRWKELFPDEFDA